jgi:aspartate racemase
MKRIGLLGGMSWNSSAEYYRLINTLVRDQLGGLHSADLVMVSLDFAAVERMQTEGRWNDAGQLLVRAAVQLEAAGADVVLLCTNTMHKVADEIEAAVRVPFLHLADAAAQAAVAAGLTKVGLLGTAFTMEESFYRLRLQSHGLEVVVPGPEDRELVHRIIYDELCLGVVRAESRRAYAGVIGRLVDQGCDGIVLGCTEIELLVSPEDSPVALLATTQLHAEAAVRFALG